MNDCHPIKAFNPCDPEGNPKEVYLPQRLIDHLMEYARAMLRNIELLQDTLQNPDAVYEGTRKHNGGGLCYVKKYDGRTEIYQTSEILVPFPPQSLNCVYLNNRDIIYTWRIERECLENPGHPEDSEDRFQRKVWP